MRFRTLVFWVVFLAVLGWAGYTIVAAGSTYLEVGGLVDRALQEAAQRRKAAVETQVQGAGREFSANLRAGILSAVRQRGVPLDEGGLTVSEGPDGVWVTVKWAFPAVTYRGEAVLSIPMSVSRSFATNQ